MPQRSKHAALRLEDDVDRLQGDARLGGDRRHRGRGVAVPLEQPLGGLEDLRAGRGGLLPAAWGVVAPRALDIAGHFSTLPVNSLHQKCNQMMEGTMRTMRTESIVEQADGAARAAGTSARNVGGGRRRLGAARGLRRRAGRGCGGADALLDGTAARRSCARARVRAGGARVRGGGARRPRRARSFSPTSSPR